MNASRREFLTSLSHSIITAGAFPLLAASQKVHTNTTGYIYDARYLNHVLHPGHPESPLRLKAIQERMAATGLSQEVVNVPLFTDPLEYISEIHSDDHIASVQAIPRTGETAKLAVAGALGAVTAVSECVVDNAFCAIRPPGHHAHNSGREEGFCFFNNVAIAARYVQNVLHHKKILIIDWDYHHGNGTQDSFYDDPSVLFFSTHDWNAYPGTGDPSMQGSGDGFGYNINVHLNVGATDDDMKRAWDKHLLPGVETFKPDFVLISAGFDSRENDTLGQFAVTDYCFSYMTKMALDIANTYCKGRLVSLLEGGYNVQGLASAVTAHVSTLIEGDVTLQPPQKSGTLASCVINNNTLFLTANKEKIQNISVSDLSGNKHKDIPSALIMKGAVNLKELGLTSGYYLLTIKSFDHSSRTIRFSIGQ